MNDRSIARGAAEGALAWLAYAVIETAFAVLVPWLTQSRSEYRQVHWAFTVLVFLLYPAAGALCGAALTLISRGALATTGGILAILGAFAAYALVTQEFLIWTYPFLALAAGLGVLLVVSLLVRAWPARLSFIRSPWFIAAIVAGVPYVARELLYSVSRKQRVAGALAYLAAVVLLSLAFSRRPAMTAPVGRRAFTTIALAAFTLIATLFPKSTQPSIPTAAKRQPGRTNIILISLDTVRADHLSVYGYPRRTTPNLDRLSADAVVYKHAFSAADMTLPGHASMLTGLFASHHGAHFSPEYPLGRPLETPYPTLAEILHRNGYATWGVVANAGFLQRAFGFNRGFTFYDDRWPVSLLAPSRGAWMRDAVVELSRGLVFVGELNRAYRDAGSITGESMQLLETAGANGWPLFLFLNYMDAHFPCMPPEPFRSMFPGRNPNFSSRDYSKMKTEVMRGQRSITPAERSHLISQYDGGIAYADAELGRLIAKIKQLGLYDESLIIVTADHGEAFGDRNHIEHGGVSVYQEEIRVPLIVKYPGSARRGVVEDQASLVDVLPTVLEVARIQQPPVLDGRSLLATAPAGRTVIAESFRAHELLVLDPRFDRDERAIYAWPLKFITSTKGTRELYNLGDDPGETHNLYDRESASAQNLETGLQKWIAMASRPVPNGPKPQVSLDGLKSLGYVQ